jgi:O-antigen/teichoic acid export membrane protein
MLVIGLALAGVMTPREFGAFAVTAVALLAARSLEQLGMSRVLVRWDGDPHEIAPTAMTISLIASVAIYAGWFLAAPAFAAALGAPAAAGVIRVLVLSVVISGLVAVPSAMLHRRSFRAKTAVDQIDNWIGVATTIGLAVTGHGLMSVAVGRLAGSAVAAVILVVLNPRSLRVGWAPDQARRLLRAGLPYAGSSVLVFAVTNVDQVVVGHLLHAADLGFYMLALCLATWPVTLCAQPIRQVAPAAFARFRLSPRVGGSAFLSSANLLACLTVPVCILISSSGGDLIRLTYGPEWAPAAHALVWLAPLAALRAFYELTHQYLAERASSRSALVFQAALLVTLVPALVVAVRKDGIAGAGLVQVVITVLYLLPWYLREVKRVGVPARVLALRLTIWLAVVAAVAWTGLHTQHSVIPVGPLDLAALAFAALAMALLVHRRRTALSAVWRVAIGSSPRTALAAGGFGPAPPSMFEPPPHPVLSPAAPLPRALPPRLRQVPAPAQAGQAKPTESLGRKVSAGARWSMVNTAVLRIANFATGVVLARFVFGPRAFGLYAVSQVVLLVLLSANEMGVSLAIVRWEGDVRSFGRTVVTLSVASSTLIYAALYVAAPQVAGMLGSPAATDMLRVICLCVIIDGLVCVPLALLNREFLQQRRMLVDSLNFVVSTGVTLWLAFSGAGAISFAWGSVAGCTVALVAATVAAPYLILPGWNTQHARGLLRFGLPLAGASLLLLGVFNVDSAIVGATLGPAALGFYQIAFNISSWPVNSILEAARRVSFAGFSRVAHSGPLLSDAFARAVGLVMALAVPACVLLCTLSEPLIRTVYGERWIHAAPALTLLAILGLLRVAYGIAYDCLAAGGRQHALVGVQGLWLAALVPVLVIGALTYGITGVAAGHVLVAGLIVGPAFVWALARGGTTVRSIAAACWRPAVGGVLMAAVSELVIWEFGGSTLGLVLAIVAAGSAYIPVVYPMRALLRQPAPEPSAEVLNGATAA